MDDQKRHLDHEMSSALAKESSQNVKRETTDDGVKEKGLKHILAGKKGSWKGFFHLLAKSKLPWIWIAGTVILSLLATWVGSLFPAYQQRFFGGDLAPATIRYGILLLLCSFLVGRLSEFFNLLTDAKVSYRMRNYLIGHSFKLPLSLYQKIAPRELISRVSQDAQSLATVLVTVLSIFLGNIYGVGLYFYNAYQMQPELAKVFLYLIPLYVLLKWVTGRINFNLQYRARFRFAFLTRYMASILMNIPLIKSFRREQLEDQRGDRAINEYTKMSFAIEATGITFDLIDQIFDTVNNLILIIYGAYLIREGRLDFGAWIGFYFYALGIYAQLLILMNLWPQIKQAQGSMQRIQDISLVPQEEISVAQEALSQPAELALGNEGGLRFENVCFAYEGQEVLHDVNFELKPNSRNALVGPSGSGKTTILKLLERFYEPTKGRILLGNKEAKDIPLGSWRQAFAYLPQEVVLLGKTVRDNLCYGLNRRPDEEKLLEALRQVGLLERFKEKGLDTVIKDGANLLSGGEAQRLMIARLLLKNPKVILLDEVMSGLDGKSEKQVKAAIRLLQEGRISLWITHHLNGVKDNDQIIVLKEGEVEAKGRHEELLHHSDGYLELLEQAGKEGGEQ